jgi:CheY-like chemotaxis protein
MEFEVFLVDDDEIVNFLHRILLKDQGFSNDPRTFLNGKACLEHLRKEESPEKHILIFLDINMPIMNGWQFLKEINSNPVIPQIYVIMLTSSVDVIDRDTAKQFVQVIDFIEKPLMPQIVQQLKQHPLLAEFFV